jgi:hypothetical protein
MSSVVQMQSILDRCDATLTSFQMGMMDVNLLKVQKTASQLLMYLVTSKAILVQVGMFVELQMELKTILLLRKKEKKEMQIGLLQEELLLMIATGLLLKKMLSY